MSITRLLLDRPDFVLILIILEVLYEIKDDEELCRNWYVLILIILEVLYELCAIEPRVRLTQS